jgi:capsular polysaccharide transport system permease protein
MMRWAQIKADARDTPLSANLPARTGGGNVTPLPFPAVPRAAAAAQAHHRIGLLRVSFALVVLLPVAIAAMYYLVFAADQYVAEFRMTLRSVDPPPVAALALFDGNTPHTAAATESQIVAQYIASRAIVDELDPSLDLRKIFASPSADWWARLWLPASIEQLVYYWKGHVDPFYDTATGTIVVRVRGFTPNDALRLAEAIVGASERLVNELSARAHRDAVAYAEGDVAAAEARLKAALAAIRDFRDRAGMIDPGKTADATAALATKLRDDLLKAKAELAALKSYMRDDAPAVRVVVARIRSLEVEERGLAREMTANVGQPATQSPAAAPTLSTTLGSYEPLDAERRFAEATYQHALEGLDRARENANRQHIYIESFVPPTLPETALYPHRWRMIGTIALLAFAIWGIGGLTLQSIREHL